MQDYEIVWILGGGAGESEGQESAERLRELVGGLGGKIAGVKPWGKRTLAYPIEKNTEGYYLESQFSMEPSNTGEFERAISADRNIIRHLLVKK